MPVVILLPRRNRQIADMRENVEIECGGDVFCLEFISNFVENFNIILHGLFGKSSGRPHNQFLKNLISTEKSGTSIQKYIVLPEGRRQ